MSFALDAWAKGHLARFEPALAECFADAFPDRLREACRYPLQTGGKRMRPMLVFAACEAVEGDPARAVSAAVAVELLHTYSLVHDDLPCMDDDDLRRGRPTVHKVYGEAMAVLVGDALLTEAFARLDDLRLVRELAAGGGAAGMIAGQVLDIGGEVRDLDGLARLHAAKTGALIRAAVRMGGLAGAATEAELAALGRYGAAVGLAFQVHDDWLDADQDQGEDGPPSYVRLLGVDETARRAREAAEEAGSACVGLRRPDALLALARYSVERRS